MNLRQALPTDAPVIADLYDLVWSQEIGVLGDKLARERCASADEVRRWIEADDYYLIETQTGIIAVMGCEFRHGTLHLVHLVIHPQHRRKGYARRLMEFAENLASEKGAVKIWFDTAPDLAPARELYKTLGYRLCGHLHRHYWGTDIVFYEKLL